MRKLFAVGSLVALTTTLLLATPGGAVASTEVTTFVGCDSQAAMPVPSHECEIGNSPGGYLEANEDLVYDICTEDPNGGSFCETNQNSFANILFGNVIKAPVVGQYFVTWTKTGEGSTSYGSWTFTMRAAGSTPPPTGEEPAPQSPAQPAPVPPAVAPAPSGPSSACLAAKARTKTLVTRLKKAGKKKKPKIKAKLRKARAAVASAC